MILLLQIMIKGTPILKMFATSIGGLPSMTFALEGVVEKWTRVLISCVIMYVTGGGQKIRNFHGRH